jgi:hypothetical protein
MKSDLQTIELPGLAVVQVPFEALPIAERRRVMGWQGPKERPGCRSCTSFAPHKDPTGDHRCTLGNFSTQAGAICNRYEPKA